MASRTQQFQQSFILTGAVVALVLVTGFALVSSRSVSRIVERQANERGRDVATHAASLVGMYLRERRREAEALARSPAVVRAAVDGSQQGSARACPGSTRRPWSGCSISAACWAGIPTSPPTSATTYSGPSSPSSFSPKATGTPSSPRTGHPISCSRTRNGGGGQ